MLAACAGQQKGGDSPLLPYLFKGDVGSLGKNLQWDALPVKDEAEARKIAEARGLYLKDLFKPDFDPYRGEDTIPTLCQAHNMPPSLESKGDWGFAISQGFYSSKERVIGFCHNNLDLLKTQYTLLFCRAHATLFIIRYFYERDAPWITGPLASCS